MLQIGLYIHMIALIIVGGGSIGGTIVEKQLWKKIEAGSGDAKTILPILKSTAQFIQIGLILLVVSGLLMLFSVNWVFLSQTWFMVKFSLFILLPIRGAIVGKPTVKKIGRQVQEDINNLPAFMKLKAKMNRFHFIQYTLVAVIIFLVIFKI